MKNKLNRVQVEQGFSEVMKGLGLDNRDPNLEGTAKRLTKMYVEELFRGLYMKKPVIVGFPNTGTNTLLYTKVPFHSTCAHHFQPVVGTAHIIVDYGDSAMVLGLSKFNRLVEYIANRPTLQEDVGNQIITELEGVLKGCSLCVFIVATHGCVTGRGVCASFSDTLTRHFNKDCSALFKTECYNLLDRG